MAALASKKPALTFVTGNAKKLEEVTAILNAGTPLPFAIGNRALDLPELQGEPEDIAREKCVLAAAAAGAPSLFVRALRGPRRAVRLFDGRTGAIVPASGPTDFGWDPVFEPAESGGLTYAEMDKAAKNAISHRGRALAQLRTWLADHAAEFADEIAAAAGT
ncbi:NADH pyrophosphatase [Aureococcus anophagefferens]|nr:NADH pyrophosphatase [Aureococcus anophagefferens]